MTTTSEELKVLLSPKVIRSMVYSQQGMQYIISALRNDPQLNETIIDLYSSGALVELFSHLPNQESSRMLLSSIACRAVSTHYLVIDAMTTAFTRYDGVIALQSGAWAYITPFDYYRICANIASASRRMGFTSGAATARPSTATQGPFSGHGATGINPSALPAISMLDQGTLYCTKKTTWSFCQDDQMLLAYENPLAHIDFPTYLNSLSSQQKLDQANTLVGQTISTLFPYVYPATPPSRAHVLKAAATQHRLTPQVIAAIIFAEARDQSRNEDAAEYQSALSIIAHNSSIGLGQILVSTARESDLFADLLEFNLRGNLSHRAIATLLASDEINIFATARNIRILADAGANASKSALPKTHAMFPGLNLAAYSAHASTWPRDNVRVLAMYYTSKPWNDNLISAGWGYFAGEAYDTLNNPGVRLP